MVERVAREIGLLGLVAVITWVTARNWTGTDWTSVDFVVEPRWTWAVVGGAVAATLIRLWAPAVAVVAAATLLGWWPASGIAVAVTAFNLCGQRRSRGFRVAVLGLAAVTGYSVGLLSALMPMSVVTGLHLVTALVCLGLPAGVRALLGTADHVVHALRERAHFLEENYRLAESTARLQERSRIAQEMHDQLGHRLSLISLYAGALELASTGKTPKAGGDEARLIRGTVQTAMRELRAILGVLRSTDSDHAALQPVEKTGLRSDITRLVEQSRSAGVEVGLRWQGADLHDVAVPVRRAVHRVVREGLTNAHRHASGSAVSVVVEHGPDNLRVDVSNGRSPEAVPGGTELSAGTGLGLVGVQERVALLGGEFSIGLTQEGGFRMTSRLPLCESVGPTPDTRRIQQDKAGGTPPTSPTPTVGPQTPFGHRMRQGTSAVLIVGLVSVAALLAVVLNALPWYSAEYREMVERSGTDAVAFGMTREEVDTIVGLDDPMARLAARSVESPPPPSADACMYAQEWLSDSQARVDRYCFFQDHLISIDRYEVGGDEGVKGAPGMRR
ncbi:sensor histidine kinase [Streptomyces ipomoeae]|uniref:sensor histidine kinase n=1 Tax=Streptomyces ipomoeae TaxID=103232 RepID=UPI00030EECF3|nr:histidine kinase [Streptomyces ipomoeae]MDX2695047.1 histidine kinase [Streptomyces ipomoeae]MDX2840927.1 histidine kinase [Streptomyces ipomoeae]